MDRKTQEEIKKTVESLQHEARAIDIHLAELPGALGTTTDWSKVWQVGFRAQADLRRLVPGVVALSQRMVKLAVAERTGSQTPGQLAELTRLLFDYGEAFPDLVTIESMGKSFEGRDLWLVTLTNANTGADTERIAQRARDQAVKFDVEILTASQCVGVVPHGEGRAVHFADSQ